MIAHARLLAAFFLLSLGGPLVAQIQVGGIAPKFLLDPESPHAATQLKTDEQVSAEVTDSGFAVKISGGPAGYPGLSVKPASGESWDLSPWGHVEAKVTNLGTERISLGIRVDNAGDWRSEPFNSENVTLNAGESKVVKVIFGHSYGFKPAFKLNPGAVTQVLFFAAGKSDKERSFRIEDLQASGSAGETPPVDPNTVRAKPDGGIILGKGVKVDAAKQIVAKGGSKATWASEQGIHVDFPANAKDPSVLFQPSIGSWDLTDYLQVQVKVKNAGQSPVTPRIRLESRNGQSDTVAAGASIAPGAEGEITIPFAAAVSAVIATDPKQEVVGPGSWAEQNWAPKPGTGTKFGSNWVKGITLLPEKGGTGASSLLITSVQAKMPEPSMPDWLGQRPPVEGEWVKTFEDNFDTALDLKTWNIYTHNYWDKRTHFTKDNAYIKDGKLVLHYEKKTGFHNDNPEDKKTVGKTDFACGFADTYSKWKQRYGYFEARVKLPKAPGLWPAFWMMPDRGPADSAGMGSRSSIGRGGMEFDILEHLTGWGPYRYNLAFHWDGYGKEHKSAGTPINYVLPDKDGYITAGLYWVPGFAAYYAQGQEVLRWESPRVSNVPGYVILYMVSGGWDNVPLDESKLPDDFVIDYVRCWQRKDLVSPGDGPQPNPGLPTSLDPVADY